MNDSPLCSRCGNPLDEYDRNENIVFDHHVGYGSKYDLMHVRFRLCCRCFDQCMNRAIQEFKISPIVGEDSLAGESPSEDTDTLIAQLLTEDTYHPEEYLQEVTGNEEKQCRQEA